MDDMIIIDTIITWMYISLIVLAFITKRRAWEKLIRNKYKEYGITTANLHRPFNRAKVLILGDEGAGKTSTRKRLCGEGFHENMLKTEGIEITSVTNDYNYIDSGFSTISYWFKPRKLSAIDTAYDIVNTYIKSNDNSGLSSVLDYICFYKCYIIFGLLCCSIYFFIEDYLFAISILLVFFDYYTAWSGEFNVSQLFTHLVIVICALVSANTPYRPFLEQTIYNVFILFLFHSILVKITFKKLVNGILLGLVLMVHQFENSNFTILLKSHSMYSFERYYLMGATMEKCTDWLRSRCLGHSSISSVNVICLTFTIVCKIVTAFSQNSKVVSVLQYLYIMLILIYTSELATFSRSRVDFWGRHYGNWFIMGIGLMLGIVSGYTVCFMFDKHTGIKTLEIILSVVVFFVVELYMWKKDDKSGISMLHIIETFALAIHINEPEVLTDNRWILCDFAGQKVYQDTHHAFIPKQGVFLVVFDASEVIANTIEDFRGVVERVQFWVQSVAIHADEKNSVVFVIGTHKNMLNDDQLHRLSQALEDKLHQYSHIIVPRSTQRMIFFIDNKDDTGQERLSEIACLRIIIMNEAAKLPFVKRKLPFRYHLFKHISSKRQLNEYVIKKSSLREEMVKISIIREQTEEELDEVLQIFNDSGDIMYESTDGNDEEYIIMDLRILLDVVQELVNIPEQYIKGGIVEKQCLEHIFKRHNIDDEHCNVLIDVLKRKDILFALPDEDRYLFLCNLQEGRPSTSGEPKGNVDLYASFTLFRADYVFLHLLSRLAGLHTDTIDRKAAIFTESGTCSYAIRVRERESLDTTRSEISRCEVLKISICSRKNSSIWDVAIKIRAAIQDVFASTRLENEDENRLKLGYLCEDCGELTDISLRHDTDDSIFTDSHTIKEAKVDGHATVVITCRTQNASATTCTRRTTRLSTHARNSDQ